MKRVSNLEAAKILFEIGQYLEMQDVPFKPRAYEKAAETIESLEESLSDVYARGGTKALREIPTVGAAIAGHIEELLKTGRLKEYERLKKAIPVKLEELTAIEGLGAKSIKKLYKSLGVKDLKTLEKAAKTGKISNLEGFGKKSEENILKGIGFVRSSGGRLLLGDAVPVAKTIEIFLKSVKGAEKITVAGSLRRKKETIGDIDTLVVAKNPGAVMDAFTRMPNVVRVYAKGGTKASVRLREGLDADLRVVPKESYGAALNYFTGSKDHNVALRTIAIKKGYKLNEYGLYKKTQDTRNKPSLTSLAPGGKQTWKQVAGRTEEDLYKALGMDYIEPELREMTGEIKAAENRRLPKLVGYSDLRGDLQIQTDWTDGAHSIEEMAQEAIRQGLEYIAITDHTKRLAMTHGLDEKRIKKQWVEIDKVNKKLKGKITILKGTECDILKDGTLDLPDSVLSKLDVVGVSVHSLFNLPKDAQTKRIIRALENPHVDILFHPTGRVINRRSAYEVDMDSVIRAAKKTGTVLEIDAYPERLDLKDEHIRMCVEAGVKMSIDSDAHHKSHIVYLEYGIAQARRGFSKKSDIINAWPLEKMLKMLK